MAKLQSPVRLKEPTSGEFQHKSRRFSLSALEDLDVEAVDLSALRDYRRALRIEPGKLEVTDDLDRDPDSWILDWEKAHPYIEPEQPPEAVEEEETDEARRQQEEDEEHFKMKELHKASSMVVPEGRGKGLIRLTGQHPLNAEPPVGMLMEAGFITPSRLHYVRNHGPVPRLDWDTHRVKVCGLVEKELELSMDELASFPSIEIPVTISCDGLRRKELQMIERTKGSQMGPGAIGTAKWKGVPLAYILKKCGVKPEAKFLCFEGADQLTHGTYGTGIPLAPALVESNDMILAYEMNGQRLPPDHGFPVRVVLPGYVGGRMVKWLAKIEVSAEESKNWMHHHDNRVFPPDVSFANVDAGGWWYKPETLLLHMNVNSVITSPAHEEFFRIRHGLTRYTLRGFAYAGGGHGVHRVEITLDGGQTWLQCNRHYPKDHIRHGVNSWVWCHWSLELEAWKLLKADEIAVRAVDSQFNIQPAEPTWNLLGMMNNCWYRIKIEIQEEPSVAEPACIFKHPVQPGGLAGGWMVPSKSEPTPLRAPDLDASRWKRIGRHIPLSEVRKHNTKDDCWVVIDGRVFDMTPYFKDHPGGVCPVLLKAGGDASREYHDIHARDADEIKEYFCIGIVEDDTIPPVQVPLSLGDIPRALNPKKWIDITLVSREDISSDTRRLRFSLPGAERGVQLGLPVGLHVLLGAQIGDDFIVRPYTPIGPVLAHEDSGFVEFVIKVYFGDKHRGRPGGHMTQHIEGMKIGDKLKMKGPAGHVIYHGRGRIAVNAKPMQVRHISMVAGGSGITPMYQLARAICMDPGDDTEIALLYANHTTADILLRKELDELARDHPQFKVWYTVSDPPADKPWQYSVGRVVEHMLRARLFPPGRDALTLLCGPPAMIELSLIPGLESLGYTGEDLFEF